MSQRQRAHDPRLLDRPWLVRAYVDERRPVAEMVAELGVSRSALRAALIRFGIVRSGIVRSRSSTAPRWPRLRREPGAPWEGNPRPPFLELSGLLAGLTIAAVALVGGPGPAAATGTGSATGDAADFVLWRNGQTTENGDLAVTPATTLRPEAQRLIVWFGDTRRDPAVGASRSLWVPTSRDQGQRRVSPP